MDHVMDLKAIKITKHIRPPLEKIHY